MIKKVKLFVTHENCFNAMLKIIKKFPEVIYKLSEFDLPLSDSSLVSSLGVSMASANPALFSMGSATSRLTSTWLPSFWSLPACMTMTGPRFCSSGAEKWYLLHGRN